MADELLAPQSFTGEIVLTERKATSEFIITEIVESVVNQFVRVEVELGPFVDEQRPDGTAIKRGSSRMGLNVWSNAEYVTIANTWDNTDLVTKVTELLAAQATPVQTK